MSSEFLYKEYECCFEQLRYYDTRHFDTLKYIFTLSSSASAALFALYNLFKLTSKEFYIFQSLLTLIVFVSTLILYLTMVRNRLCFVRVARQLNAIRGFLLETEAMGFTNNQLYTSTNTESFKLSSIHTLQLIGGGVFPSLFSAVTAYGMYPALGKQSSELTAIFTFCIVFLTQLIGAGIYLNNIDKKTSGNVVQ